MFDCEAYFFQLSFIGKFEFPVQENLFLQGKFGAELIGDRVLKFGRKGPEEEDFSQLGTINNIVVLFIDVDFILGRKHF